MRQFVITPDDITVEGMARAVAMLGIGAERLHLRTVGASEEHLRSLIEAVPAALRERVSIHEHLSLAIEYGLGGVHLNSRSPKAPAGFHGMVSRSCHDLGELARWRHLDYVFLSPIFDSISKPGYHSRFTKEDLHIALSQGLIDERTVALGGMMPSRFGYAEAHGFGGVALLGAAFAPVDRQQFRLQYITPTGTSSEICQGVEAALRGDCRWVQLRMKGATASEIIAVGHAVAELCRTYDATFILDDHPELVAVVGADGVHLGRGDMSIANARSILGVGYIIGATANTAADLREAAHAGADYIGLGPLRFTTTKKNLSPTLGYEGYRAILGQCRAEGIDLPVVAIGGIEPTDIAPLVAAGADGVAVSGAIANADNPEAKARQFIELLNKTL